MVLVPERTFENFQRQQQLLQQETSPTLTKLEQQNVICFGERRSTGREKS